MAVNRIWLLNAPVTGVSAADRAQILIGYSGIALAEVATPPLWQSQNSASATWSVGGTSGGVWASGQPAGGSWKNQGEA